MKIIFWFFLIIIISWIILLVILPMLGKIWLRRMQAKAEKMRNDHTKASTPEGTVRIENIDEMPLKKREVGDYVSYEEVEPEDK